MTITECAEKRVVEIKHEIDDLKRRLAEYEQATACVTSTEILDNLEYCKSKIKSDLHRAEKTLLHLQINISLGCDPIAYATVTAPLEWNGKYKARLVINYLSQHSERYYIDEDVFWMFAPFFKPSTYGRDYSIDMDRIKGYLS